MRFLITVLVVLACAVMAWSWFVRGDAIVPVAPPVVETGQAEVDGRVGVQPPFPASEASRTPLLIDASGVDARYLFHLRVVRASDGEVLPGIEVRSRLGRSELDEATRQLPVPDPDDIESVLAVRGRVSRTDAAGRVTIAHPESTLRVVARDGGFFADATYRIERDETEGEFELRLVRDHTVVLLALDESDRPVAGTILRITIEQEFEDGLPRDHSRNSAPADFDGRIVIRHAQTLGNSAGVTKRFEFAANLFGIEGDPVRVELAAVGTEPIVVRVPPSAAFDVVCLGPDGLPWQLLAGERSLLSVEPADPERRINIVHAWVSLARDGTARAGPVRCGVEYRLQLGDIERTEVIARAPARAGERARVELCMAATAVILSGRLVDPGAILGTPLPSEVLVEHEAEHEQGSSSGVDRSVVQADGRFRCRITFLQPGRTPRLRVVAESAVDDSVRAVADIPLSEPLHAGINDVGDVVLAVNPVLVAGRVQWAGGGAPESVQVRIEHLDGRGYWDSDQGLRAEVDEDGGFYVRAPLDRRRYRLTPHHPDALPGAPIEFTPGARELIVQLDRGGTIAATFLVDSGTPLSLLDFELIGGERALRGRPTSPQSAQVVWRALAPDEYRLVVRVRSATEPLVEIAGLRLHAAAKCDDERLTDIDLRGLFQVIELRITDERGRAIEVLGFEVLARKNPGTASMSRTRHGAGFCQFLATGPVDLIVGAPGFLTREFAAVTESMVVQLAPAPRYMVRCSAAVPDGVGLAILGEPVDPDLRSVEHSLSRTQRRELATALRNRSGSLLPTGPEGSAWRPHVAGEWSLSAFLVRGRRSVPVEGVLPDRIDTRTWPSSTPIELSIDPAALATALAKLPD